MLQCHTKYLDTLKFLIFQLLYYLPENLVLAQFVSVYHITFNSSYQNNKLSKIKTHVILLSLKNLIKEKTNESMPFIQRCIIK